MLLNNAKVSIMSRSRTINVSVSVSISDGKVSISVSSRTGSWTSRSRDLATRLHPCRSYTCGHDATAFLFEFRKVLRQQISGDVVDNIIVFSVIYLPLQQRKSKLLKSHYYKKINCTVFLWLLYAPYTVAKRTSNESRVTIFFHQNERRKMTVATMLAGTVIQLIVQSARVRLTGIHTWKNHFSDCCILFSVGKYGIELM